LNVEEKEVAALQRLGLTEYEARIYLALARMGPIKASEVSFFGNVPRTKTYGAIRELEKKSLLSIIPGKPEIYAVRSPSEVLMPLVTRLESDVAESTNIVHKLALTYESNVIVRSQHPKENKEMWVIEGRANVLAKMNELFGEASKSINYCTSANGLIRAYKANSATFEKARTRGATLRMLTPVSPDNNAVVREMEAIAEIKILEQPLPAQFTNFVSVDSSELLISEVKPDDLSTERGSDLAIWNRNKLSTGIHDQLFMRLWDASVESRRESKAKG
jgi:sugar-specific transcriptional regulator TrmB